MAAPDTMVFDLDAPRRPGPDDVDATVEQREGAAAPMKGMPYADQLNQWAALIEAYGRVVPILSIEVRFSGGTPTVFAVQALRSTLTSGNITVTDNGLGDVTLTWPANTLPAPASSPTAHIVDPSHGSWLHPTVEVVTNGVRVKTRNSGGTLADVGFKVHVH